MPTEITCRRFIESLSAWHDGELAEVDSAPFEMHRARCAQCARYAAAFQAAIALVRSALAGSVAHVELPEGLVKTIVTACRRDKRAF
jgi:anti-sigma factor RsiW